MWPAAAAERAAGHIRPRCQLTPVPVTALAGFTGALAPFTGPDGLSFKVENQLAQAVRLGGERVLRYRVIGPSR